MAYTTTLSAKLTALQADKPCFLTTNVLTSGASMQWRTGVANGTWASADTSDSALPVSRLYDKWNHVPSQSVAGVASVYYLLFDFGASGVTFDSMVLFGLSAENHSVELQIADDNAYSVNLLSIAQWTVTTSVRVAKYNLGPASEGNEYGAVRYARLVFTVAAGNWILPPTVTECVFGLRHQLSQKPNYPHDPENYANDVSVQTGTGGYSSIYVKAWGQQTLSLNWTVDTLASLGVYDLTQLRAMRAGCRYGADFLYYCSAPWSAPNSTLCCRLVTGTLNVIAPTGLRDASIELVEQAPFLVTE